MLRGNHTACFRREWTPFERIRPGRVIHYAYAKTQFDYRPHENPTRPAHLDYADTSFAYDADRRKGEEGDTNQTTINKNRSCPRGQGENNAAQFPAETTTGPEGSWLISGIHFPVSARRYAAARRSRLRFG